MTNIISSVIDYFKRNKKLYIYLTIYILLFFIFFRIFINDCFEISNDKTFQYEIFYQEWIKILFNFFETGHLNTFSFNMFLGTDFYSALAGNVTTDIFLPIVILFRNDISMGLLIETILCVYICAISMSLFLENKGIKNKDVITFISLIYSVGGQAAGFVSNPMFHRFLAFLPLLFLGEELFLKKKKISLFIISSLILFLQNYYFMYMTLIFLFLYSLVECLSRNYSFKTIIKLFFQLLGGILIGFLLSCIMILPSIMSLGGTVANRKFNGHLFWDLNAVLGIFSSIIANNPVSVMPTIFNMPYDSHGSEYNLFITLIPFGFILLNYNNKPNRKRNILLLLLFLIAIIKPLNSIMHGFSIPSLRWVFLLEFYMLYLSAIYMDQDYDKNKLFKIFIGIVGINVVFLFILYLRGYVTPNTYTHINFLIISYIVDLIIAILFKYVNKLAYVLSFVLIFASTIYCYGILSTHLYVPMINRSEIDLNQNYDSTYYRYYNSYMNSFDNSKLDANSSLLYEIMTTSTYCSNYDPVINDFINLTNSSISLSWNIEISDPELLTMLGTKYYIVGERMEDEYKNNTHLEYKYSLSDLQDFDVYYNKDYRGFGYCAENVDYFKNYKKDTNNTFVNTVFVDDDTIDISKYQNESYAPLEIEYMGDNYVYAEITNNENNILLIPMPNNKGWSINVNGESVTPISVNGGFIGLMLEAGHNVIEMRFSTPYLKIGCVFSCIGLCLFICVLFYEKKKKSNGRY